MWERKKYAIIFTLLSIIINGILLLPTTGHTAENESPYYLYAIRGGILAHDINILAHSEEDGVDFNLELLFTSPDWLEWLWAPHPHLGVTIHSQGDTHQIYSGLTWEKLFSNNIFINLGCGLSLHSGNLKNSHHKRHEKELGSSLLFREALEVGYQLNRHHSLSLLFFHISNAGLSSENDGMNHLGIRYGYSF
ncbi:MAG: acyloxyacyl hydrolase [Deltaproteobacteria bacterium]|nr:acyloxyacyl hydrolase [Candidatus Tharpella sp.]